MAKGINKWHGIGNLGADPEIRYTPSGKAVTTISIGCGESYKDKEGNKKEHTEWVRVVFFSRLAEIAGEYLKKGSQVYVEGKLRTNKWQAQDGTDRYTTEILANEMQMLSGQTDGQRQKQGVNQVRSTPGINNAPQGGLQGEPNNDFDSDEIPF